MASLPDEIYRRIAGAMHPVSRPWEPICHRRLGERTDVYILTEGVYDVDPSFPFAPADQGRLEGQLDDNGRLPSMSFGMALVRLIDVDGSTTNVLLDAGVGPWDESTQRCDGHPVPERPARNLLEIFKLIDPSLTYEDIDFVVYSHCHGDHVGWTASFSNAVHCMHRREYDFATYVGCPWRNDAVGRFGPIEAKGKLLLLGSTDDATINKQRIDVGADDDGALTRLPLDEQRAPGISLILVDGHTPGHVCVEIRDGDEKAIYLGDCMHFPLQVTNPSMTPVFDCCAWKVRPFLPIGGENVQTTWSPFLRNRDGRRWNESTSCKSRRRIMEEIAADGSLVLSPHFPPPGMGRISRSEDGFRYAPLPPRGSTTS